MRNDLLKGLTEEQIAKVKACKTQEEILTLARNEGIELTDEQLAAVSGGCGTSDEVVCPKCKCNDVKKLPDLLHLVMAYKCNKCGHQWDERRN